MAVVAQSGRIRSYRRRYYRGIVGLRFIAAPAFVNSPDTVHVVVTSFQPPAPQGMVIFDQQSAHQASAVYQQLVSGGSLTMLQSCPAYSELTTAYYHCSLTFFRLGVQVARAASDARGCQAYASAYVGGLTQYYFGAGQNHVSFWVHLHQMMGAPIPIGWCQTTSLCSGS